MKVRAKLDEDSSAMEPLGSIVLVGDDDAEIVDADTYLDAWFTGLLELIDVLGQRALIWWTSPARWKHGPTQVRFLPLVQRPVTPIRS